MNSSILTELTQDIKKLSTLEQSIIDGDHTESSELRSKQALLISEVIQSLQKLKTLLKTETQATMVDQQTLS